MVIDTILFEHPKNKNGSGLKAEARSVLTGRRAREWLQGVKRELSNSRIAVSGIENSTITWQIGAKTYEPLKMRVFLEALWKRMPLLEKAGRLIIPGPTEGMGETAQAVTGKLRQLKTDLDQKKETTALAEAGFRLLTRLSRDFLTVYFETRKDNCP